MMAINLSAFLNPQGAVTVDERIAIDDVGTFRSPNSGFKAIGDDMVRIGRPTHVHHLVGHDVVGVLSPCQQLDGLRIAIGDELQFVFHHERRVEVVRVDGDAQEGEEAIVGRDDLVINLGGTFAVKIETERGIVASDKTYGTDFQVVAMRVVDSQFVCGRAQRGKNSVEENCVGREFQLQIGVGIDRVVLLT